MSHCQFWGPTITHKKRNKINNLIIIIMTACCGLGFTFSVTVVVSLIAFYINQHTNILPSIKIYTTPQEETQQQPHQERTKAMEELRHRTVRVNGIAMHVAEKGKGGGPVVLFIHGFPELWYSWRHQINALAALGYRAVAPDMRGFGDTEAPGSTAEYSCFHVVGDMVALLDVVAAEEEKVFVVGHDWGAMIAWYLCLFRPDRVKALVNMSVLFNPRNPNRKPLPTLKAVFGDDYYICRFQEPGEVEKEFDHIGTETVLKEFYTYRTPGPLFLPKGKGFGHPPDAKITLPSWLSEEDFKYYINKYEKTGFTPVINYYRNIDRNWELTAPWTGSKIKVPVKFIVGDQDLTYNAPGAKDYIDKGGFKRDVPFLEEVVVLPGVAHFLNQEKPDLINKHIHDFFQKF